MTAKSYAKGSLPPPVRQPGILRLYSMRFCPFAKRARLVLAAKKIPFETININLDEKPEWYIEMHPHGKVPLLEGDGILLTESLIISQYLDDAFPGVQLTPTDAYERAKERMILEISFAKVMAVVFKFYKTPEKAKETLSESHLAFAELEKELEKKTSVFFGGKKPSFLDLMMWPFFELIMAAHHLVGEEYVLGNILPKDKYPLLTRWIEELLKFLAVDELHEPEILGPYLESVKSGQRNFDAGL